MQILNLEDFRAQFPLVREYTFLNHAATSPLSRCVVQAMEDYLFKCQYVPKYWNELVSSFSQTQSTMAELINASPLEIAFVENTAKALA